jgi:hypothetical protein
MSMEMALMGKATGDRRFTNPHLSRLQQLLGGESEKCGKTRNNS